VGVLEVGGDDAGVAADHGEVGVAEEGLQGEEVAAVAQVVDGEGVAEKV